MLFLLTLITGRQAVGLGRELFHYKAELLKNNYQRTCARSFIRGFKSGHQELLFNQPVFEYAHKYKDRIALRDRHGQYTYSGLYFSSEQFSKKIRESDNFVVGGRIAFLCPNDASYVLTQWACWISRQIVNQPSKKITEDFSGSVPLSKHFPQPLMEYYINDCNATLLVTTSQYVDTMYELSKKTNRQLLVLDDDCRKEAMQYKNASGSSHEFQSDPVNNEESAMILYTSGSTGQPKGVVLSHRNLQAQVSSQVEAWQWQQSDTILHCLPLHHIHGVVNALLTPLMVGAKCIMHPLFNPTEVWNEILGGNEHYSDRVSIFMGVPTMYINMLNEYDRTLTKNERMVEYVKAKCSERVRLMVSGSAPLPHQVSDWWHMVTGHTILERYGMTEIGMALSNPLRGQRKPGFVGTPMPGVRVQIMEYTGLPTDKENILVEGDSLKIRNFSSNKSVSGLLRVKGYGVFKEYWNNPEATAAEFSSDGWFLTGDIVEYTEDSFRILGRSSVDIIKTGGYKVSALQIEYELLDHPDIVDVAVVGLPDITWGQKVAAVVQIKKNTSLELRQVQHFIKERLPVYMMPSVLKVVEKIPRNSLGKVNKRDIAKQLFHCTSAE